MANSEAPLYNFLEPRLLPKASTSVACTEYHEVENLISNNFLARARGFVADTNCKTPVHITFEPICSIDIHYIVLSRNLNHDHQITIDVQVKTDRGSFTSIAYEDFKTSGIVLCNSRFYTLENLPPYIDQNYKKVFFKSRYFCLLSAASKVKIGILKIARSVPALGRVEIWGKVSRVCPEATIKTVNDLMQSKISSSASTISASDTSKEEKNFEIPDDFIDSITFEVMALPVTLPCGKTVDESTLNKCIQNDHLYGRLGSDPFTGQNFNNARKPVFNTALKQRIDTFLMQNAHRKETFGIKRTVGIKRKVESDVSVSNNKTACISDVMTGLTPEETLNQAIEKTINNKRFIHFTSIATSKEEPKLFCTQCKAVDNLYLIPCNHFYCKMCLLVIYKQLKCGLCSKPFEKGDPKKLNS